MEQRDCVTPARPGEGEGNVVGGNVVGVKNQPPKGTEEKFQGRTSLKATREDKRDRQEAEN